MQRATIAEWYDLRAVRCRRYSRYLHCLTIFYCYDCTAAYRDRGDTGIVDVSIDDNKYRRIVRVAQHDTGVLSDDFDTRKSIDSFCLSFCRYCSTNRMKFRYWRNSDSKCRPDYPRSLLSPYPRSDAVHFSE